MVPGEARRRGVAGPTQGGATEPSAGEREGAPLARKEPSAGEREGAPLARKEPSAGEREGIPLARKEPSAGEREGAPLARKEPSAGEREGIPSQENYQGPKRPADTRRFRFDGALGRRPVASEPVDARPGIARAPMKRTPGRKRAEERYWRREAAEIQCPSQEQCRRGSPPAWTGPKPRQIKPI